MEQFAGVSLLQALKDERHRLIKELKTLRKSKDIFKYVNIIMDISREIAEM